MKILQRFHDIIEVLDQQQSIPSDYEPIFEERLILICSTPGRLPRKETPRPKSEYKAHDQLKRARKIYLEVLERFPRLFVPFILVVSPRSCQTWKASAMWKDLKGCMGIPLGDKIYQHMECVARNRDISQTAVYKRMKLLLFPPGMKNRPSLSTFQLTYASSLFEAKNDHKS
jgi:hypothetical protein